MKHFDYKQKIGIQLISSFYGEKSESHYLAMQRKAMNKVVVERIFSRN